MPDLVTSAPGHGLRRDRRPGARPGRRRRIDPRRAAPGLCRRRGLAPRGDRHQCRRGLGERARQPLTHWRLGNVKGRCAAVFASGRGARRLRGSGGGQGPRRPEAAGPVRRRDDRRRHRHAAPARLRRRPGCPPDHRDGGAAPAAAARHRLRRRPVLRLLRHRRRLPDRARADARHGHAAHLRHRHIARRRRGLRGGDGRELRGLGPRRLVARRPVRRSAACSAASPAAALGKVLASRKQMLGTVFASLVIIVGLYVVSRGSSHLPPPPRPETARSNSTCPSTRQPAARPPCREGLLREAHLQHPVRRRRSGDEARAPSSTRCSTSIRSRAPPRPSRPTSCSPTSSARASPWSGSSTRTRMPTTSRRPAISRTGPACPPPSARRWSRSRSSGRGIYNLPDSFPTDGSQWDRLFADGERFTIGNLDVEVMFTPGHTLASIAYVVGDAAFIHDTIFMPDGGTARADFPGRLRHGAVAQHPTHHGAARRDAPVHRPRLHAGRARAALGEHGRAAAGARTSTS